MKSLSRILLAAVLAAGSATGALAVTQEEMNQAQVVAATQYIRFSNNASGYLDDQSFATMADLEKALQKDKDRQSLAEFKKGKVDQGYASWNKDQLAAYWSSQFFTANKDVLNENSTNGLMRKRVEAKVKEMKVTPPAAAPGETAAPEAGDVNEAKLLEAYQDGLAQVGEKITEEEADATADSVEQALQNEDTKSQSSGTWVYVMVLAILVAVVIVLVVYASRTMKGSGGRREEARRDDRDDRRRREPEPRPEATQIAAAPRAGADEMEVKHLNRRIGELSGQLSELRAENARLEAEKERLRVECDRLRDRLHEAESKNEDEPVVASIYRSRERELADEREAAAREGRVVVPQGDTARRMEEEAEQPRRQEGDRKEIYLGRVNSRGIFVRADRSLKPGLSIYRLTTNNGLTGTFQVVASPSVADTAFEDPGKWLAGGCIAKDIFDTADRVEVITETPGTAVFEDGAWRVMRKARIRYE